MSSVALSRNAALAAARLRLRTNGAFEQRIRGRSMGAAIPDGASVRVEYTAIDELRPGDVVAFLRGDELVAHRLVHRIADGRLLTQGDGNCFPDVAFGSDALLGRVVAIAHGEHWGAVPADDTRPWGIRLCAALTTAIVRSVISLKSPFARAQR